MCSVYVQSTGGGATLLTTIRTDIPILKALIIGFSRFFDKNHPGS